MEFTGERYMPSESGQIRHEHMHRYSWCRPLVQGRVVLDIACGEGYGSAMLAPGASRVFGVDISAEAVDHARRAYAGQPNLEYLQGSAAAIPLPDASVDVVVSFETLEHHDQHEAMMREIRRVLRPEGLLVMSSPNRVVYSEKAGYHNEFHVKELDFREFDELMHAHFGNVRYYGQRLAVGSALFSMDSEGPQISALTDTGAAVEERTTQLIDPVYFIAVATAEGVELPSTSSSVLFSESEDLYTHHLEVAAWAQRLNSQHSEAIAQIEHLVAQQKALRQEAELVEARTVALRDDLAAAQDDLVNTRGNLAKSNARIRILEETRRELELIKASRSWRWTRPLRFALRVLRAGGRLGEADREQFQRRFARSQPRRSDEPANLPSILAESPMRPEPYRLAAQVDGKRDFFVWAVIDWHFRIQRPQHLSRELANVGHRVFYISNDFVDHGQPGFAVEPLDAQGRLFRIQLHLRGSPGIYHAVPKPEAQEQLQAGVRMLLAWTRSRSCASLVQHPYWLETARILPNHRMAYDCMDHHGGFADNSTEMLSRETDLMCSSDLLVVTSDWLYDEAGKFSTRRLMVRNACQYEHFARRPGRVFTDAKGRRVIGYYGAIAEWLDLDLVERVARDHADCLVLLIGADTAGARERLRQLSNVEFTGEVPYSELPFYLHGFDVCLLPFQVIPLTLATNPVKVYEYLSAGKAVVSIALPEIRQFGDLVRTGDDHASFLLALDEALHATVGEDVVARRQRFAAEQTWAHRVHDLVEGINNLPEPRVSVVVVTYNNLELTKACLSSLERFSDYTNLEVIVVDNASADDTPAFLSQWVADGKDRQLILNPDNRGFAGANNQGLAAATGEYLVMLNNDTYVTPGWIATLVSHLRRSRTLGMIGPVTNNIGNEARIDIVYDDMEAMMRAAGDYTACHAGQLTTLRTAAFFCVMMSRAVYEKVGPLDEAFGIGFFEDDDYCRRVDQAGWSIACAEDVFVHHQLSASFNKLKQERRAQLFEQNKMLYEKKWGPWEPHRYRPGVPG